jgi:FMN-dependent oxidoreductase (nitrilotriacetate monooxygenase family)
MSKRQMKFGAFLHGFGHHQAAWRHPSTNIESEFDFRHYLALAQTAERGRLDLIFLADSTAIRDWDLQALRRTPRAAVLEPLSLLAALAVLTQNIGLIATASTTYNEPFTIARKFATIDQLSGGRAGWNLVTSASEGEAKNFHLDTQLAHDDRYARAAEFASVVRGLWDSWDDDAFPRDKESGIYFDPDKMHILDHKGPNFSVRGPLNARRSPQGHPVIVQAGSSGPGKALAAQTADIVFTAQPTLSAAQSFYRDVKRQAVAAGRSADDVKILPGLMTFVGATKAEAQAKFDELQALVDPEVGLAQLSELLGRFDLSGYPIDGPLPEIPETNGGQSRQKLIIEMARRDELSIRELYLRLVVSRGFLLIIGTPNDIADQLAQWFTEEGADGFNLMPAVMPGGLDDFINLVVPELQSRGLMRTEYEGQTLRENLGLARPANRFRAGAAQEN